MGRRLLKVKILTLTSVNAPFTYNDSNRTMVKEKLLLSKFGLARDRRSRAYHGLRACQMPTAMSKNL